MTTRVPRGEQPNIARLRELEAAVPPAPWFYPVGGGIAAKTPSGWEVLAVGEMEPAAAEFLVAARNALPELLDALEARQQGRDRDLAALRAVTSRVDEPCVICAALSETQQGTR